MALAFLENNEVKLKPAAFIGILIVLIIIGYAFGVLLGPKENVQNQNVQECPVITAAEPQDFPGIAAKITEYVSGTDAMGLPTRLTESDMASLKNDVAKLAVQDKTNGEMTAAFNSVLNAISAFENLKNVSAGGTGNVNLCEAGAGEKINAKIPALIDAKNGALQEISVADESLKKLFKNFGTDAAATGLPISIGTQLNQKVESIASDEIINNLKTLAQNASQFEGTCSKGDANPSPDQTIEIPEMPPDDLTEPPILPPADSTTDSNSP